VYWNVSDGETSMAGGTGSHRIRQCHFGHCASLWWCCTTPGWRPQYLVVSELGHVQRPRRPLEEKQGPPWPRCGTEWYISNEGTAVTSLSGVRALAGELPFRGQQVNCGGSGTVSDRRQVNVPELVSARIPRR
jgi:hypothetical protein